MTPVEATYFAWLDVSELQAKLGIDDMYAHFLDNGLALSAGTGMGSAHHVRLNFAVPRSSLEEGVRRLRAATML